MAEAKEAAEFAGAYKEAKKCRAYETYQLLAGLITFGERAAELLTTVQVRGRKAVAVWGPLSCRLGIAFGRCPVGLELVEHAIPMARCSCSLPLQSRLGEASHPKTRAKLAQLLQHAARGVLGNPTGAAPCLEGRGMP